MESRHRKLVAEEYEMGSIWRTDIRGSSVGILELPIGYIAFMTGVGFASIPLQTIIA